jgi:eukaryotic-like serine/threonine-protein kinase
LSNVDFVIRSGRALVYPVYKGTYERNFPNSGLNAFRDVTLMRVKDFRRTFEYLLTRPDIDRGRIGFYGVSLGAFTGTVITTVEPRLKATVFLGGGLGRGRNAPEADPLNFVPRIQVPTLMINGDSDFQFPLQFAQLPQFRLLSLPPDRKRHALFVGGHMPNQINDIIREVLDWYDRFLGPVTPTATTSR